jgi:hypothetical protein
MHLVGQPAMQSSDAVADQVAAGMLSRGSASVAAIAEHVGYESESARSRSWSARLRRLGAGGDSRPRPAD